MRVEKLAWTHDDDIKLVEAILRNVRKGGSAIEGCREFAESTNGVRSVDSSKFRFHTQLKEKYAEAYKLAKAEGKKSKPNKRKYIPQTERMEKVMNELINNEEAEVEIDDVMVLLKRYMKQTPKHDPKQEAELLKLREENKKLKESNIKLNKAFNEIEHDYKEIKQALSILKKAGLMFDVPPPTSTVKYRVDKNGLVETIE